MSCRPHDNGGVFIRLVRGMNTTPCCSWRSREGHRKPRIPRNTLSRKTSMQANLTLFTSTVCISVLATGGGDGRGTRAPFIIKETAGQNRDFKKSQKVFLFSLSDFVPGDFYLLCFSKVAKTSFTIARGYGSKTKTFNLAYFRKTFSYFYTLAHTETWVCKRYLHVLGQEPRKGGRKR